MHRHHDATGEPHAGVRGEVERLVGDAHVHRLVGGQARAHNASRTARRRQSNSL